MNALQLDEQTLLALKAAQTRPREAREKDSVGVPWGHLGALLGLGLFHYLVRWGYFGLAQADAAVLKRFTVGVIAVVVILTLGRVLDQYVIARMQDAAARYNVRQVARLLGMVLIGLVVISLLFANWYTALVSLGVASLVLGLALQTPVTSFIGWIYLLMRAPYRVGDRVKIGDLTGDVIEVGYLDTTLWEFGGDYLGGDHPSGRIIKFPNSLVLEASVINYTWPLFPYIWNEIKFHVGYDSDLRFVTETMQRLAEEELGQEMCEKVARFRELLASTPVDELQVKEKPSAFVRVSDNTWLEATVRYLVLPREAGPVKSKLTRRMLEALLAEPDKVRFPKGDMR